MIRTFSTNKAGFLLLFFLIDILSPMTAQTVHQIEILNADLNKSAPKLGKGVHKLLGNVKFRHEGAVMYCDSAIFYSKTYSMDAYSNVKIVQGDTLFLYGDRLHYEGQSKIAQVRRNVKLIDDSTVLVTNYLDYDRINKVAYYLNGGIINEGDNQLTSEKGYYYTETEIFNFKDSVVIINPDYTIQSDTLEYNTKTHVAYFFGPTNIVSEENFLYCESGWYDTDLDISLLQKNAFLVREGRTLQADTLYYERGTGLGRANSSVQLYDSAQNVYLIGNKGIYYEIEQLATLTDSALMIQVHGPDTLYVHADTLRSIADTSSIDDKKILLAYYKVKIFRHDIQGMCDSLTYVEKDSTFHLYGSPIIWSDENQINASKIEIKTRGQELYRLYLRDIALLIAEIDSAKYNQIRGKSMVGYFKENELVELDVTGNGQTIYYPIDQGEITGANRAECTDLIIFLKDNKVNKVKYKVKPTGKYYPLEMFPAEMRFLDGFSWNDEWRPKNYMDIYRWK